MIDCADGFDMLGDHSLETINIIFMGSGAVIGLFVQSKREIRLDGNNVSRQIVQRVLQFIQPVQLLFCHSATSSLMMPQYRADFAQNVKKVRHRLKKKNVPLSQGGSRSIVDRPAVD